MRKRRKSIVLMLAALAAAVLSLAFAQPSRAAVPLPGHPAQIQNYNSLLCVQTNPANGSTGIQLVQHLCQDGNGNIPNGALWNFVPLANGLYNIVNVGNGGCLDAVTNTDFGVVETFPCTGISNQKWSVVFDFNSESYELISHVAGGNRCLDVLERSNALNTTIDIFHCTNNFNTAQLFFLNGF